MKRTIQQMFDDKGTKQLDGDRLRQLVGITDRLMVALCCLDNNYSGSPGGQAQIDAAKSDYFNFIGPKWKPTPEEIEQLKAGQRLR